MASVTEKAGAVEYAFNPPTEPLIWDVSGAYALPLSSTLHQNAEGVLTSEDGGYGQVSGNGAAVALSFQLVNTAGYWVQLSSTHMKYVLQDSRTTALTLQPDQRQFTGKTSRTTIAQEYELFLWTWAPYRHLTTNHTAAAVSLPLPDGVDGHWKLTLPDIPHGSPLAGEAQLTLSGGNTIPFQIEGAHLNVTKTRLTLRAGDSNYLNLVTLGPAMDLQSLRGQVAGQLVNYVAPAARERLSLQINGNGAATPLTEGKALAIGTDYTLQAIPRPANLFSNWIVAGTVVTNPTLRFTMVSNLVITANFVTNSFLPASGGYNGLFYEAQEVRYPRSGFFTLNLANSGAFSGSISVEGGRYPFSGRLDLTGRSQIALKRGSQSTLTLALELNAAEKEIHGSLSDGSWVAGLTAYHLFSSASDPAAALKGTYTLVIPGSETTAGALGDGLATLSLDGSGTLRLAGTLADGTSFTRALKICRNGLWPLYVPLYSNKGALLSWIHFDLQPAGGLGGDLVWFKPAGSSGPFYPAGFTQRTTAIGSAFTAPVWASTNRMWNITNGVLTLTGGNLPVPLTSTFHADGTATGTNGFTLKWDARSGAIRGAFVHPATGGRTALQGVLLQVQNLARGFFLGTNESGAFWLQP